MEVDDLRWRRSVRDRSRRFYRRRTRQIVDNREGDESDLEDLSDAEGVDSSSSRESPPGRRGQNPVGLQNQMIQGLMNDGSVQPLTAVLQLNTETDAESNRPDEGLEIGTSEGNPSGENTFQNSSDNLVCSESGSEDEPQDNEDNANIPPELMNQDSEEDSVSVSSNDNNYSEDENSSSEEEEDNADLGNDDQPLYEGARISVRESLLAIFTFSLSHRLTGSCIADLLSLISLHCGPNTSITTLYKFKRYFSMIGDSDIIRHHYCCNCEIPIKSANSVCSTCAGVNNVSYFIELPIENQLQKMFMRPGFYESLGFRFNRIKKNENSFEDIYDGAVYKEFFENNRFLCSIQNISFFMYYDGVSLYKSSNFSIWPIVLSINELPYKDRTQKENMVIAGLWFGSSKPNSNLFLRPLHNKLSNLEVQGVNVKLPNDQFVTVKCKLLANVGDLPAKAIFLRFKQFNAMYSCFVCMSKGERYALNNNCSVQVFPYSRHFELRSNGDIPNLAQQAVVARQADRNASIYGIKGPSLLYTMLPDMITCSAIDVMHGVFLGLMKSLMQFWFHSQFSRCEFSLSALVDVVDSRLKTIKPPSTFQRSPPSIKKDLGYLKAADLKIFFFYYSLPTLLGLLPDQYWKHHCKIVSAVYLLSQDSVSTDDIEHADNLLHSYIVEFEELYGLRYLGLNVHQLLHLPTVVRNLGPLWVYSCFFYESLNGQIARLVHGTTHAALQISAAVSACLNLPSMLQSLGRDSETRKLCTKFLHSGHSQRIAIRENIDEVTFVVGPYKPCNPVPNIINRALNNLNVVGGQCKYFFRLKRNGVVYHSETYLRSMKKMSCFVEILENDVPVLCIINSFVRWSGCRLFCNGRENNNCYCPKRFFCIATKYERELWEIHDINNDLLISLPYLSKVKPIDDSMCVFPVNHIRTVLFHMRIDGNEFLAKPINLLEVE